MLNFGIVGLNGGNGHPYSFSAVFNGYDPKALERFCDYPIIREYLTKFHCNREFIANARIDCVYAPEQGAAERVAKVAKIPHVASSLDELAERCDAILFTRDDIWNHWEMAGKLFRTGKPIYMDKVLASTPEELEKFIAAAGPDYPLMTASSFRFAPEVAAAKREVDMTKLMTVRGMSPCIWVRYAPHLLDALFELCGRDVVRVQNSGRDRADIVTLTYRSGLQAVLQIFEGISLPLGLELHFKAGTPPRAVPYTDPTLESYFFSIAEMMRAFTEMVATGKRRVSWAETVHMNRVVLAGIASRERGGCAVQMDEFMSDAQERAGAAVSGSALT